MRKILFLFFLPIFILVTVPVYIVLSIPSWVREYSGFIADIVKGEMD